MMEIQRNVPPPLTKMKYMSNAKIINLFYSRKILRKKITMEIQRHASPSKEN